MKYGPWEDVSDISDVDEANNDIEGDGTRAQPAPTTHKLKLDSRKFMDFNKVLLRRREQKQRAGIFAVANVWALKKQGWNRVLFQQ